MKKLRWIAAAFVVALVGGLFIVPGCAAPAYVAGRRTPIAVSPDVQHAESRIDGKGGVKLFVQSWRPPQGTPRAVLVIVHGLKDHSDRYATFAERLVRKGFAVHALDLRGHGDSEGDRVWVDAFDDYVDDLDTFVKRVRSEEGAQTPLFVFGHSMGGAIVTLYALRPGPDLQGVILSGPALKPGSDVNGALIAVTGVLGNLTPTLAVLDLDDTKFSRDPEVVAAMKTDPLVYDGAGPARTAKELLGALERIGEHMAEFRHPLLIVHGGADTVTNPEGSKELVAKAVSKDKTLKIYEGLYHDVLHEPEKEQVMTDLEAWLEARAPAPVVAPPAATAADSADDSAPTDAMPAEGVAGDGAP